MHLNFTLFSVYFNKRVVLKEGGQNPHLQNKTKQSNNQKICAEKDKQTYKRANSKAKQNITILKDERPHVTGTHICNKMTKTNDENKSCKASDP